MRWLDKLRGMADQMRGLDLPVGEWVEIRGVTDTTALVRAIDAVMPRGATLNVMYPVDDNVEAFLRAHGGARSRPAARDYHLPIEGSTIAEFAGVVARCREALANGGPSAAPAATYPRHDRAAPVLRPSQGD